MRFASVVVGMEINHYKTGIKLTVGDELIYGDIELRIAQDEGDSCVIFLKTEEAIQLKNHINKLLTTKLLIGE